MTESNELGSLGWRNSAPDAWVNILHSALPTEEIRSLNLHMHTSSGFNHWAILILNIVLRMFEQGCVGKRMRHVKIIWSLRRFVEL